MVKKSMDNVSYEYKDGKNTHTITKNRIRIKEALKQSEPLFVLDIQSKQRDVASDSCS